MKKTKITLSILFSILLISHAFSEVIFDGDVTLSTQEEVDAFSYTEVNGGLTISGNDITNLNALSSLTRVYSLTIVGNGSLTNLDGLSTLKGIGGSLFSYLIIADNPSLANVDGLSSLLFVSGHTALVVITNNAVLSNIDGLSSLSSLDYIGCAINISNNPSLKNVNGLTSLSEFGPLSALSSIAIYNNAELENIDGLSNLRGIFGQLFPTNITITDNPSLSRCSGLYPLLVSFGWDVVTEQITNKSLIVEENGAGCTIEDIIYGGPQLIEQFTVINKKTGVVVNGFVDDVTLDLADPEFSNWAIEAHTFPSPVGAVQFKLEDKSRHTDKVAPYTFVPHPLHKVGTYTFSATPYSGSNKKGEQGIAKTATIIIINSGANNLIANNQDQVKEVSIYPVPVKNELHLKVNDKAGNNAVVTIRNMQGNLVYTGSYSGQESQTSGINTLSFQPGVYVLQVLGSNGFHNAVRFIKK